MLSLFWARPFFAVQNRIVLHITGEMASLTSYLLNVCSAPYSSGEGNGNPLQYSCLEDLMDGGAWWTAVHEITKSDMTEWLHFHFSLLCIGEGNDNLLQCSCLENPRDGGAWWAAVYGVAQSRTQLKWLSSSSNSRLWAQTSQQADPWRWSIPPAECFLGRQPGQAT